MVECFLLAVVLTVPVLVVSYCAMRLNLPMADERLAGLDARLAFDAPAIVSAIGQSPVVAGALGQAYGSFGPQLILLPPVLALLGHRDRAYAMVTGYVGRVLRVHRGVRRLPVGWNGAALRAGGQ